MNRWTVAWRNVTRHRRRSLISGGLVAFGFVSFALAGGFMAQSFDGLRQGAIRGGLGHLQFADARAFERSETRPLEFGLRAGTKLVTTLRANRAAEIVMPRLEFFGLARAGGVTVPFAAVGIDPVAEAAGSDIPETLADGRWLKPEDRGVVIGQGLARLLNARAGDRLTLLAGTRDGRFNTLDVRVTGIADIRVRELSERYLALPLPLAQSLLGAPDTLSRISVRLAPGHDERAVAAELLPALPPGLAYRLWSELAVFYQQVRVLYISIFGFMGTVLMVIVFLSAINTTLMSVTERTREIGTLRALGARSRHVTGGFVREGALLGLASTAAGVLLSLAITALINAAEIRVPPPPGMAKGVLIHVQVIPAVYLLSGLAMTLTLVVATWLPARRAARAPIVESLAHV